MPYLENVNDITKHLRQAIKSKTTWVFAAVTLQGQLSLMSLAENLAHLGVRNADLGFGWFEFCEPDLAKRERVDFLSVPKNLLTTRQIALHCEQTGFDITEEGLATCDLIGLGTTEEDGDLLGVVFTGLEHGALYQPVVGAN